MTVIKRILLLCSLIFFKNAHCDALIDSTHREDTCLTLCNKIPLSSFTTTTTTTITTANSIENDKLEETKSCCQRGCRFFNLINQKINTNEHINKFNNNETKDSCESDCNEAYFDAQSKSACTIGCKYMAKQNSINLLSLLSLALYVDETIESNILLMSLDLPESDIMSDPGLKKETLPRWWDLNGFKLPRTFFKSVPKDSMTLDYNFPADYSGEMEQADSSNSSNWLQCASRHTGIPRWFFCLLMIASAAITVWLSFFKNTNTATIVTDYKSNNISSKIVVIYPAKSKSCYTQFIDDDNEKNT